MPEDNRQLRRAETSDAGAGKRSADKGVARLIAKSSIRRFQLRRWVWKKRHRLPQICFYRRGRIIMLFRYFHGDANSGSDVKARLKSLSTDYVTFDLFRNNGPIHDMSKLTSAAKNESLSELLCIVFHASQVQKPDPQWEDFKQRVVAFVVGQESDLDNAKECLEDSVHKVWAVTTGFQALGSCQSWKNMVNELGTTKPPIDAATNVVNKYINAVNGIASVVEAQPSSSERTSSGNSDVKYVVEKHYWNALTILLNAGMYVLNPNNASANSSESRQRVITAMKQKSWWIQSLGGLTQVGASSLNNGPPLLTTFVEWLYGDAGQDVTFEAVKAALDSVKGKVSE